MSHTILDAIGNTPLLQIDGIWVKCEFLNPSGSIKARLAKYCIARAEAEGLLRPGDTIVEATSGNTGNALAMVAATLGYRMVVLMPEGLSTERVQISRAFGAEIRIVGKFHVREALEESKRLGQQSGFFCPHQFDTEWNVDENRAWLGREIIDQLPPLLRLDALVQGVGTGGTLIGVGQALRESHNPDVEVVAVEPAESPTLAAGSVCDHQIEGIADGFVPGIYARHAHEVTRVMQVRSEDAIAAMKMLASMHGILAGPSSGANYVAAAQLRAANPHVQNVLTFFCDEGEKYLHEHYREDFDPGQAAGFYMGCC